MQAQQQQPGRAGAPLLKACAAAALALVLAGCSSPGPHIDRDAQVRAASSARITPSPQDFPALDSAQWKQGAFAPMDGLRAMRTGMGKDQVREALSFPHFREGLWGSREWNYIFHFRTGAGPEYVTCQYMVRFNDDVLTEGLYWKDPACALLANPPVVKPVPVAAPVPRPAEKVTLGADGLFRFDGSSEADLLPEGERRIKGLAGEIKRGFKTVNYVVVTGHTDRLGSDAYNERLSLARANTVRALLVREGLEPSRVRTAGMGKRAPVVTDCPGTQASPELVKCLQPNRRVEIEVQGEQ